MNETEINVAIKSRLHSISALPFVWPNLDPNLGEPLPVKPYIVAQIIKTGRDDETLAATRTISRGLITLTFVTNRGQGERAGTELQDLFSAAMPATHIIPLSDGQVKIMKPADTPEGFLQDGGWRTPITFNYQAS